MITVLTEPMPKTESNILSKVPLDKMSDKCLQAYIMNQIKDWPVKLNKREKDALYTTMWNSVVSMQLKQMSQHERDAYYAKRHLEEEIRQKVQQQIQERKFRLKTHHVYV